ncbi:hypothetical protein, partial [Streptomyces griseocarneus]
GINQLMPIESRDPDGRLVRFKAGAIGNQPEGFYSVNVQALATAAPGDRTVPDGLTIGTTTAQLSFHTGYNTGQPADLWFSFAAMGLTAP